MQMTVDEAPRLDLAKQAIRRLVAEITDLSKTNVELDEFCRGFLERSVRALAALGGAIWLIDDQNSLQVRHQINIQQAVGQLDRDGDEQHRQLLIRAFEAQRAMALPPKGTDHESCELSNPAGCLVLLQPISIDGDCVGLVEIFHEANTRHNVQHGYQRFLQRTSELASNYFKNRRFRTLTETEGRWQRVEAFARLVHNSLVPRAVMYTAVNDGRALIGCDRLSLALRHGQKVRIEAVSGQDALNPRSNLNRQMNELARVTIESKAPIHYTQRNSSVLPNVAPAFQEYASETGAEEVLVVPICETGENGSQSADVLGVLIAERFKHNRESPAWTENALPVALHVETALNNALRHDRIFLKPAWRWLARTNPNRRTLPRLVIGLLLPVVLVCFLILVPAELRIEGKGTLLPQTRREVFAGESGVVRKLLVEHGSRVKAGEVIVELENIDLVVRLQQLRARTVQTRDEIQIKEAQRDERSLSEIEMIRIDGELNSLKGQCASLHRELVLLESQKERLMVRAPISGIVTTWEPEHLLAGRPVQTGNRLLSIAKDTDAWVLEIELPEDRIGHVLQARQKLSDGQRLWVEYILATNPEQRYHGWLETIAARAEVTDGAVNIVKLTVALNLHETPLLRTGAEVRAHVICGQRSIGYVWFHELSELFYSRVLF